MLRFTNVNLKPDIDKFQFVKSKISGGISMTCKRCANASNKFLKSHNAKKPTFCIIYLSAFCSK